LLSEIQTATLTTANDSSKHIFLAAATGRFWQKMDATINASMQQSTWCDKALIV
jgi:hypothetical protein